VDDIRVSKLYSHRCAACCFPFILFYLVMLAFSGAGVLTL
jgi:hypothetical protein